MMSTPPFAVSEAKNRWLAERMTELGVREEELEERFVRSSGKGGQHVNKSSTCVQIVHLPSGIEARCDRERSQSLNRFLARRELLDKLARARGLKTTDDDRITKLKKQKARRQRRSRSAAPAPDQRP